MSPRWPSRTPMDPDRFQMKDLKRRVGQLERDMKRLHGLVTRRLAAHDERVAEALISALKEVKGKK